MKNNTPMTLDYFNDFIEDNYVHVQIDTEKMFSSKESLEKHLRVFRPGYNPFVRGDYDLEALLDLSRKYPLTEWAKFTETDSSNYQEVMDKIEAIPYGSLYYYVTFMDRSLRQKPHDQVIYLIEKCEILYLISGKTEWSEEVKKFDLVTMYENFLEAYIQLDLSIEENYKKTFLEVYWEELKKDSPLGLDRYYAAMIAGKDKYDKCFLETWENRKDMKPLNPASGNLFYFDTEVERDAYVEANPEQTQAIHVDELRTLEWPCTSAVRPEETFAKVGEPLAAYAVFMGDKLFGVYETLEQAEALKSLMSYKGIKIMKTPTPKMNLNTLAGLIQP